MAVCGYCGGKLKKLKGEYFDFIEDKFKLGVWYECKRCGRSYYPFNSEGNKGKIHQIDFTKKRGVS